jgi:acyl-CoA thioesterase-1
VIAKPLLALLIAGLCVLTVSGPSSAETIRLVALGDSLTAGYGLADPASEGFPAQLQSALRARGHDVTVVDAGVSGDTSTGGLARVDWSVGEDADGVIVELGANDMLRGIDPQATERALDALVGRLRERGLEVLVAGMVAAPNLGADYGTAFNGLFPRLAERHDAVLYPFFLDGVAADATLNQPDGIHPSAAGVAVIVERIMPKVEELIARIEAGG